MGKMICSHCGEVFEVKDARVTQDAPYHDYPKPCRSVCPGSKRKMLRWGDVRTPLGVAVKESEPIMPQDNVTVRTYSSNKVSIEVRENPAILTPAEARKAAVDLLKMARMVDPTTKRTLEEDVRDYLNELANPAPDATMRMVHRERMADQLGMVAPHKILAKWREGSGKK